MTFPVRLAALALGSAALCAAPLVAHPIVPGSERFPADPAAGQLLLGELNCTSCHTADGQAKKQAPVLDAVGTRARVSHLKKFLADPQAVKPGTTMPNLFTGDPARDAKVEALVHFLASTGTPRQTRPDLKAVIRGRDTYAKIGCAACHGPRDNTGEPSKQTLAFAVPLGDLKGKYTIPALAAFLASPLQTRPSGRMPHLLKPNEAQDVAHYLLQMAKVDLPAGRGTTRYAYFEGEWEQLPDFSKLKPKASGIGVAFELALSKRESNYGMRFEGFFSAEVAGKFTFTLSSDDGSQLLIDGKKVVDNDGIHATQSRSDSVELTKGVHKVMVDFFQGGGEAVLDVEVESRTLGRQPLGPLVAATEADLNKKPEPKNVPKDEDALTINPELAATGKALFASIGCANCHNLTVDKTLVTSTAKTLPFKDLKREGGCLADAPKPGLPNYVLNDAQRKAIAAAMTNPSPASTEPGQVVARTMLTFNCYACHARDKVGGLTETTNHLFTTTTPEMGDEGRVPPPLDGVGAKLNPDYLKQILDKGADDRPYMHTSMPGFGQANVGHLIATFAALDKLPAVTTVKFTEPETKVKTAGRHMVGAQAFGCIKCHTFAGQKAEGVQGIDMLLMTKRLKRDWFHAYCVDPQKIRPGTRMPTAWPNGQSVLPSLLDGSAATQIEAIWVFLGSKSPQIPAGMGRKFLPLVPTDGAIIYRNFIEGAGNRAIGVGYPEKLNLAFDANELRLAMIWKGGFIDAARHWTDRGAGAEGPLGDDIVHLPAGPNFAVLAKPDTPWPTTNPRANGEKFLGYRLTKDERPTFRYSVNGATIEDTPNPSSKENPTLRRTIRVTAVAPVDGLAFRAAVGSKIESTGGGWFKVDNFKVRIDGAAATIRQTGGKAELVVPVRFADGTAQFVQEFAW
jgi:mono/diheme cytochrome c family protein